MSDERLRELERRWKETGSPEDEAAYLLERVRAGDLSQERLELAAYCGHQAATRALGSSAPRTYQKLELWIRGLARWGVDPALRCSLALCTLLVESLPREQAALEEPLSLLRKLVTTPPSSRDCLDLPAVAREVAELGDPMEPLVFAAGQGISLALGLVYLAHRGNTLTLDVWRGRLREMAACAVQGGLEPSGVLYELGSSLTQWVLTEPGAAEPR